MNRIFFLLRLGIRNTFRHRETAAPLIISMFVLITINLMVLSARNNIASSLKLFTEKAVMEIILEKGTEQEPIAALIETVRNNDTVNIDSIVFKDETQNLKEFIETDPDLAAAVEMLEQNPLPPTVTLGLRMTPDTLKGIDRMASDLRKIGYVKEVIYPGRWFGKLNKGLELAEYFFAAIIASLLLVTWLLWISIFRTSIYSVRDEIEIMETVGGTRLYIRTPFYVETFIYAAVSFSASFIFLKSLSVPVRGLLPELVLLSEHQLYISAAVTLLLAMLGTEKAINRILR